MSARNTQSDTSRVIVKNPLLSAVAGSIDDFVNNTILMPAAEIPAPVVLQPQTHDTIELKDNRGKDLHHSPHTHTYTFAPQPTIHMDRKFIKLAN